MNASEMPGGVSPRAIESPEVLEQRYASVRSRIASAAKRAGRREQDIVLVAVSKYAEPDQVRQLIRMGHRDFGENYVQNLIQRAATADEMVTRGRVLPNAKAAADLHSAVLGMPGAGLKDGADRVRWHLIGHLQRNKVKKALEFCRLIHTVDSLRLAEEIQAAGTKREEPVEVLVQVNCSLEEQKTGCPPSAALHLCEQIDTMIGVRVRGLMTMAAVSEKPEDSRGTFSRCYDLFDEIRKTGVGEGKFNILSMGMSNDFEVAIEEGANIVRVGSAIFGEARKSEVEEEKR
jgi:pyridoxal phosphate enzyme (YggS family)